MSMLKELFPMSKPQKARANRLCKEAEGLAIGAQRAAEDGDMVAFCHLLVAAQERALLASQLEHMLLARGLGHE